MSRRWSDLIAMTCDMHSRILLPPNLYINSRVLDLTGDANRRLCMEHLDRLLEAKGVVVTLSEAALKEGFLLGCCMCLSAWRYSEKTGNGTLEVQMLAERQISSQTYEHDATTVQHLHYDLARVSLHYRMRPAGGIFSSPSFKLSASQCKYAQHHTRDYICSYVTQSVD
jgi:hypothetical protein